MYKSNVDYKLERLDDGFLFIIALASIIFAFLQVTTTDKEAPLLFFPYLTSGILFSFYIEHMRGAVELGSKIERLRGWIYFGVTTLIYGALLSVIILRDFYKEWTGLNPILYLVVVGIGAFLLGGLVKWLMTVSHLSFDERNESAIYVTGAAAVCLSAATYFSEEIVRSLLRGTDGVIHGFDLEYVLLFYIGFIVGERVARYYSKSSIDLGLTDEQLPALLRLSNIRFAADLLTNGFGFILCKSFLDRKAFVISMVSVGIWFIGDPVRKLVFQHWQITDSFYNSISCLIIYGLPAILLIYSMKLYIRTGKII